jgi:heat shock protein HtpX
VVGWASGEQVLSWGAILLLYFAPALSTLLQYALSRTREFDADLEGAMLTGDPIGLAQALRRLDHYTGRFWEDMTPPVPARRIPVPSILRTHPPTKQRIDRLLALSAMRPAGEPPLMVAEAPLISLAGWGPVELRPRYRWPGIWL